MSISPKTEELVRRLLSERFAARMNGVTHVIYNPTLNQTKMALDDKTTLTTKIVRSNAKKKRALLDYLRRRGQRRTALRH
jgi:hypothetical protein